jgi:hypothetical protein
MDEVKAAVDTVEKEMGKKFGDKDNTLLFSVRSGAAVRTLSCDFRSQKLRPAVWGVETPGNWGAETPGMKPAAVRALRGCAESAALTGGLWWLIVE